MSILMSTGHKRVREVDCAYATMNSTTSDLLVPLYFVSNFDYRFN